MSISKRKETGLNDKKCFEYWLEFGSLALASRGLVEDEFINPSTGKKYTEAGIRLSALRYVIMNIQAAKEALKEKGVEVALNDKDYYLWVIGRAISVGYSGNKLNKWLTVNNLWDYSTEAIKMLSDSNPPFVTPMSKNARHHSATSRLLRQPIRNRKVI